MSEDGKQRKPTMPPPRVGMLTIVGLTMFVVLLFFSEVDAVLLSFGGLMVLSSAAYWTAYFLDRRRRQ